MARKKKDDPCCGPMEGPMSCCSVEGFVSVDERGQMVLPKDIREKAGIKAGDKLAVVTMQKDGKVFWIGLIRADEFGDMVRNFMGPAMGEIFGK
ncbi:MAG: AbrB/MazE/SpoVT family DNA-binding domain-containing protein [Thermoplasmata archaeon]|nr:MAG: AbrB/MazE/SpoVT family DNA-binding domain-containing protein [Thermoplasmata archaeon]